MESESSPNFILYKLTNVEYLRQVLLKYVLESLLVSFLYYWVVHKKERTPNVENLMKIFVWVIVIFTLMDLFSPQTIPYIRAGIGLSLGSHISGGIKMVKSV